jgi:hypothetical protein
MCLVKWECCDFENKPFDLFSSGAIDVGFAANINITGAYLLLNYNK